MILVGVCQVYNLATGTLPSKFADIEAGHDDVEIWKVQQVKFVTLSAAWSTFQKFNIWEHFFIPLQVHLFLSHINTQPFDLVLFTYISICSKSSFRNLHSWNAVSSLSDFWCNGNTCKITGICRTLKFINFYIVSKCTKISTLFLKSSLNKVWTRTEYHPPSLFSFRIYNFTLEKKKWKSAFILRKRLLNILNLDFLKVKYCYWYFLN